MTSASSRMRSARSRRDCGHFAVCPSCGMAISSVISGYCSRSVSTASAAYISMPSAPPEMKCVYPSRIIISIELHSRRLKSTQRGSVSSKPNGSFCGRCPVNATLCRQSAGSRRMILSISISLRRFYKPAPDDGSAFVCRTLKKQVALLTCQHHRVSVTLPAGFARCRGHNRFYTRNFVLPPVHPVDDLRPHPPGSIKHNIYVDILLAIFQRLLPPESFRTAEAPKFHIVIHMTSESDLLCLL